MAFLPAISTASTMSTPNNSPIIAAEAPAMALIPEEKAAALILLLDAETRQKVLSSFSAQERSRVDDALTRICNLPHDELRRAISELCADPVLKIPITERDLDEWFSRVEEERKQTLLNRSTLTRILMYLDPRTLFYRK
ncbi:MAG TPA: hypothetical protein PLY86_19280 [bacterium]|nr:hypothetical protein [bacterium]